MLVTRIVPEPAMPHAYLPHRGVLRISGGEARSWLNNIVTCDLAGLAPGEARFGALLTPQGKILFDFLIFAGDESTGELYLETGRASVAELAKRLAFYRLRARIGIEDLASPPTAGERWGVVVQWDETAPREGAIGGPDPRHPHLGWRWLMPEHEAKTFGAAEAGAYEAHRIGLGIPEAPADFTYGEVFPHETLMDMLGGVDFRKGCYVGQEVVSRMQHRGTARTRIAPVTAATMPPPGTEILAAEKVMGRMGSSAGTAGLAMLRLDRVEEALAAGAALVAGDSALTLVRPDWWAAAWPQSPGAQASSPAS
jgi:folate-binding protein YgfZ